MAKKIHQWPQHSTERIFTPPYSKWRNGAKGSTIAELIAARSNLDGGTAKKTPINKLNLDMTNLCPKSQKMMADWLKHLTQCVASNANRVETEAQPKVTKDDGGLAKTSQTLVGTMRCKSYATNAKINIYTLVGTMRCKSWATNDRTNINTLVGTMRCKSCVTNGRTNIFTSVGTMCHKSGTTKDGRAYFLSLS